MAYNISSESNILNSNFNEVSFSQDENEVSIRAISEQSLWRAVITQALMDAASNSRKKAYIKNKAKAIAWLFNESEDFDEVCYNAGYDPKIVRKKAALAVKNNFQWRLPAGQGAKYLKNRNRKALEENCNFSAPKRKYA